MGSAPWNPALAGEASGAGEVKHSPAPGLSVGVAPGRQGQAAYGGRFASLDPLPLQIFAKSLLVAVSKSRELGSSMWRGVFTTNYAVFKVTDAWLNTLF